MTSWGLPTTPANETRVHGGLFTSGERAMARRWIYLDCPACGKRLDGPFSRYSGPITHLHHRRGVGQGGRACRLLIIPDAIGHNHEVREVAPGVALEAALDEALDGLHEVRRAA